MALIVTAAASAAASGATERGAGARVTVPAGERVHPRVTPPVSGVRSRFALTFTARTNLGHVGVFMADYRIAVSPPRPSRPSCGAALPAAVTTGSKGAREHLMLPRPPGGWCRGRYTVTVFLERGPYCQQPANGPPSPCPEFATQELPVGSTDFTVR
jgi:hypothetical protein